jgi:hypothetical protein
MDHTSHAVFSRKIGGWTTKVFAIAHTNSIYLTQQSGDLLGRKPVVHEVLQSSFAVARGYSGDRGGVLLLVDPSLAYGEITTR